MILNPKAIKHVVVDGNSLTLESFVAVARYGATVELAESALEAMKKSRALAEKIASEGRETIFGDVVVRVSDKFALAMHIDTDESNAAAPAGKGIIIK